MAMVKIATGKTVKVGTRSKGGGYEYEVQADGSIKNLTTGRTTAPAVKQAPVPKERPKAAAPKAAAPKAPVPKTRPKAAPVPAPRLERSAPQGPQGRGGKRGGQELYLNNNYGTATPSVIDSSGLKNGGRPIGFTRKKYVGPFAK